MSQACKALDGLNLVKKEESVIDLCDILRTGENVPERE